MGSRNHEVVPTSLISHIAKLPSGNIHKLISDLAKNNLIAKVQNMKCICFGSCVDDGYRLTYGGYDYLALRTLSRRDVIYSVGHRIGVGKEADIYIVADQDGVQNILKIHRLGRMSFRNIKAKRDYMVGRKAKSWLYLSRLAAMKEYTFMKLLWENGFAVPRPIDYNRHCLLMELVDATPLYQVRDLENPAKLYSELMSMIVKLANGGLIHGDFNEFNLLLTDEDVPIMIDFPQMVSIDHPNAEMYFDRDVECIRVFFKKRFGYEGVEYPRFSTDVKRDNDLDLQVEASGFTKRHQKEFDEMMAQIAKERVVREEEEDEIDESSEGEIDSDVEEEERPEEEEIESDEEDKEERLEDVKIDSEEEESIAGDLDELNIHEDLDAPNNHDFRPFRDKKPSVSRRQKPALSSEEIKEIVKKSLKGGMYQGKRKNVVAKKNRRDTRSTAKDF